MAFEAIDKTTRKSRNLVVETDIGGTVGNDALLVKVVAGGGGGGGGTADSTAANQVTEIARLTTLVSQTDGIEGSLTSIDTKTPALSGGNVPVVVSNPGLTDAQLRASAIVVSNPTSAALTDAQLRASAVPVSLSSTTVTGTVAVSAAALPLPAGAATETTLAALNTKTPALGAAVTTGSTPVNIASDQVVNTNSPIAAASGSITTQNLVPAGVATAGSSVELTPGTASQGIIQVVGTYTGALSLQCTVDGTTWVTFTSQLMVGASGIGVAVIPSAGQSFWRFPIQPALKYRVTALAAVTGTAVVTVRAASGPLSITDSALASGSNSIGQVTVVGSASHSSASTGAPVRVAGRVNTAVDTTLIAGDSSDLFITTGGAAITKAFGVPELDWQFAGASGGIVNTTDVVAKAAAAAGVRNYVTSIDLSNASATATEVVIKDGATVIWRGHCPANSPGRSIVFPTPLRGTAATAVNVACITTAAAVYVNLQGFTAP